MPTQPLLLTNTLDEWDEHLFCGRDAEIAQFGELISHACRLTTVLTVYGIGGVGKSTLLRAFVRHATARNALVASTSADNYATPIPILLDLSKQLSHDDATKRQFSDFHRKVARLRTIENRLRNRAQGDSLTPSKLAIEAMKGGVGSAAGAMVGTAIAGQAGAIAGGMLGGMLGPVIEEAGKALAKPSRPRGIPKDDAQYVSEADRHITKSFANALSSLATGHQVVLIFDAIEYLGDTLHWLRDELLPKLSNSGFLVVLAGRYALPHDQWLTWTPRLVEVELHPFERHTTLEYLSRSGVTDAQTQAFVHEQTSGLPLAVALLAAHVSRTRSPLNWQQLHPETDLSHVVEIVTDSLLERLPDDKLREALWVCSIPRWFNQELLSQLLAPATAEREYDLFSTLRPLIRSRPNGLSLHDTIRAYLSKSLSIRSPGRYSALHQIAKGYFEQLRRQLEPLGGAYSDGWQTATLELIYHQLVLGDIACLTQEFECTSRFYQHAFARRIIADIESYQGAVQGIARVYAYHKGQNLIHHNDFLSAIAVFKAIPMRDYGHQDNDQTDSLVSYQLGKAYFWFGDTKSAGGYLTTALRYFELSHDLRMQTHAATFLSRVSERSSDLRRAIHWRLYAIRRLRLLVRFGQDDDRRLRDSADRLYSLGEALRLRGTYSLALHVHLRCIDARRLLKNEFDIGESYIASAKCFSSLERYDEEEYALREALAAYETTHDEYMLSDVHLLYGQLLSAKGARTQAISHYTQATRMAETSQNTKCYNEAKNLLLQSQLPDHGTHQQAMGADHLQRPS